MNLKIYYRLYKNYYRDLFRSRGSNVKLFNAMIYNKQNYTCSNCLSDHWIYQFIKNKGYNLGGNTLSIFGVNGDPRVIDINKSKYKIFYTAENVHDHSLYSPWYKYEPLLLENNKINLSLGFDYLDHSKYLRFPFWIMSMFEPNETLISIKKKCDIINDRTRIVDRIKFCAFICRKDYFGDRLFFADEISKIDRINYPSSFLHNDDDLVNKYGDNKKEYLKQFKFNLCPENTNSLGLVTEKLFECLETGCIPIYYGSDNQPEPTILNRNAICFLQLKEDNAQVISQIKEIHADKQAYQDFINQKPLLPDAAEYIYQYFVDLDCKIKEMLK